MGAIIRGVCLGKTFSARHASEGAGEACARGSLVDGGSELPDHSGYGRRHERRHGEGRGIPAGP